MPLVRQVRAARGLLALAICASGCAHYNALPLPTRPALAASLSDLSLHGVALDRPLSVTDVVVLAVANDPDLRATRLRRGVAEAQVLQAGLLANPTLVGSVLPLVAGPAAPNGAGSSTVLAFNAGLSYDIRSLITRGARRQEAAANLNSLEASLLWQEWQVIAQARLLCVDIVEGDRLLAIARRLGGVIGGRAEASRQALRRGDVTLSTAAPDLAALQAARNSVYDQERQQLIRRHQLAALLGLSPDAPIHLASALVLPPIDPRAILGSLPTLPERRPDLAALRYGYQAEDARMRVAILSQFPNFTLGVTGGSDNSNVRNIGPEVAIDLPIFDHNQGQIATERASRAQLRAEYAARLAQAVGSVRALLTETAVLQRQLAELRRDELGVAQIARAAQAASRAGILDERSALDLILTRYTKEAEIVTAQQALLDQRVAIATITGAGLPPLRIRANRR